MHRVGWLRAAVLGANDGIVSTASLIVGVAAAGTSTAGVVIAGVAGLVAGAMSMAAGEYVSVSSQADIEQADLAKERLELETQPEHELAELAAIYTKRGVDPGLARTVASQLMDHDALGAHARDELGISKATAARPVQAALASAGTFSIGAGLPLLMVLLSPMPWLIWTVSGASLLFLATLGSLGAWVGGAPRLRAATRVTFWGALAMALTAGVGFLFGVAGLVAGAMSMAAGEYVSVSSQADTEGADVARERVELAEQPEFERQELAAIYVARGLTRELATQVAEQLTAHDALGAHARDELGVSDVLSARPVQAGLTSAATFAVGAALPLLTALVAPAPQVVAIVAGTSLVFLTGLGAVSARAGGAPVLRASVRVAFWGALAMGLTAVVGWLAGTAL